MSVNLLPQRRASGKIDQAQLRKMLDENSQFIQAINDCLQKGKASESIQYQASLHRNLTFLAALADYSSHQSSAHPSGLAPQPIYAKTVPILRSPPSIISHQSGSAYQRTVNQGRYSPSSSYSGLGSYNQGSSQSPSPPHSNIIKSTQQNANNYPQSGYLNTVSSIQTPANQVRGSNSVHRYPNNQQNPMQIGGNNVNTPSLTRPLQNYPDFGSSGQGSNYNQLTQMTYETSSPFTASERQYFYPSQVIRGQNGSNN